MRLRRPAMFDASVSRDRCPTCEYALAGLPPGAATCPECGGSLSVVAFVAASARRMSRNTGARLALLGSPIGGIFSAAAVFVGSRGAMLALGVLGLWLWLGATVALYRTSRQPPETRLIRSIVLGLPLGVAYFASLVAAALIVVWIVVMLDRIL